MYKLLIVEDEILARIGLRQLLDWEKNNIVLLPDATDGEEALQIIREQKPDIILLDLNIPKINGLRLLRIMKDEEIRPQVIIVSCHEEFEMVKEAMKLGAYDYLRKLNLSAEEMEDVLRRCMNDRGDEKRNSPMLKEVRYDEILKRRGPDVWEDEKSYHTLLGIVISGAKAPQLYELNEILKKQLEQMQQSYICIRKDEQVCYFLFEEKKAKEFYHDIYSQLKLHFKGNLYLGVCDMEVRQTEELNTSIALAEQVALAAYYDEEGQVLIFHNILETKEHCPAGTHNRQEYLKKAVEEFNKEEIIRILQEHIQTIRMEKYISINVLRRNFMDILGFFSMTAQGIGRCIEELYVQDTNCHYQKLMQMNSLWEIEGWFLEFNERFYDSFYIAYKSARSELLRDALEYIELHLSEVIKLNEAARIVGVSSAHLSTYFKKEIGFNFIEYVNMRKVEAAKDKLKLGQRVQEVSEALGFENSTYFSKVFKKYTGTAPANYRNINGVSES